MAALGKRVGHLAPVRGGHVEQRDVVVAGRQPAVPVWWDGEDDGSNNNLRRSNAIVRSVGRSPCLYICMHAPPTSYIRTHALLPHPTYPPPVRTRRPALGPHPLRERRRPLPAAVPRRGAALGCHGLAVWFVRLDLIGGLWCGLVSVGYGRSPASPEAANAHARRDDGQASRAKSKKGLAPPPLCLPKAPALASRRWGWLNRSN